MSYFENKYFTTMIKMPMTFAVVVVKRVISTLSLNSKQTHLQADKDNMLNTTTKYPTKSQNIHIEYFRRASRFCCRSFNSSFWDFFLKSVEAKLSTDRCESSVEAYSANSSILLIFQKIINNFRVIAFGEFVGNLSVFAHSVCYSPRRARLMQNFDKFGSRLFPVSFPHYAYNSIGVFAFQNRFAESSFAFLALVEEIFCGFFYSIVPVIFEGVINRWNYRSQLPGFNLIETRVNKCVAFEQRKAKSVRNINQLHKFQWGERCVTCLIGNLNKSVCNRNSIVSHTFNFKRLAKETNLSQKSNTLLTKILIPN